MGLALAYFWIASIAVARPFAAPIQEALLFCSASIVLHPSFNRTPRTTYHVYSLANPRVCSPNVVCGPSRTPLQ